MKMKDPYQVLGVPRNASEKEIKAAYKELVKKYHPDQYQDNPLAEFAEEKMAEINTAYDAIMSERRNGGSSQNYSYGNDFEYNYDYNYGNRSNAGYSYDNSANYNYGGVDYLEIRRMISSGNVTAAEQRLDAIPQESRNAEWFFLKGNIAYTRGWLDEAFKCFQEAYRLDPQNQEYAAAFNRMNSQGSGYMRGNPMNTQANGVDTTMNCLSTLCLADCCCECMGGDLIRCI